jgi:hypothetical protein
MTDCVKELSLKLNSVCADARKECSWEQIYYAVTLTLRDVLRSCDCGDCRKAMLRHANVLGTELQKADAEARERYPKRVGSC